MTLKTQFAAIVVHNQHVPFLGINTVTCSTAYLPAIELYIFAHHAKRIEVASVSWTDSVILNSDMMCETLLETAPSAGPQKTVG